MQDPLNNDDLNKPKSPVSQPQATAAQQNQPVGAASARPQAGRQQPKGSGFVNLQKVIGASQGNRLGSTISGNIKQAGEGLKQDIGKAQQEFAGQVDRSRVNTAANQQAALGLVDTAAQGGELSEEQLKQAEMFRSGEYQGPNQLQNAAQLGMRASDVEQLGQLATSAGGRQALLQKYVGRPQYTAGQQRLDTLLLGKDRKALAQARSATQGVTDVAAGAMDASAAQAAEAASQNQAFKEKFLQSLTGKTQEIDTGVNKALEEAQAAEQKRTEGVNKFKQMINDLETKGRYVDIWNRGGLKQSQVLEGINALGLAPEKQQEVLNIYNEANKLGVNPAAMLRKYVSDAQAQGLTKEGVMSQQQAAGLNALAKLAGKGTTDFQGVGTFKAGQTGLDTGKVQGAVSSVAQARQKLTEATNQKGAAEHFIKHPNASFDDNPALMRSFYNETEMDAYNKLRDGKPQVLEEDIKKNPEKYGFTKKDITDYLINKSKDKTMFAGTPNLAYAYKTKLKQIAQTRAAGMVSNYEQANKNYQDATGKFKRGEY